MVGTIAEKKLTIEVRNELLHQLFPQKKPRDSHSVYDGAEFLGDCIKPGEPYVYESGQLTENFERDLRKITGNNYPEWIKDFSVIAGPEVTIITIKPVKGQAQNLMDYLQKKGHWLYRGETSSTKVSR